MGVVWGRAKVEIRTGWGSLLFLALLIGLGGGVAIAAVAGARRTDSAFPRFLAYNRPEDVFVQSHSPTPALDLSRVRSLPQVDHAMQAPYLMLSPSADGHDVGSLNPFAASDSEDYREVERPLLVSGRLARPDRVNEATINSWAAAARRLRVGDHLRLYAYTPAQMQAVEPSLCGLCVLGSPKGPAFDFTIVGVVRQPADVGPVAQLAAKQRASYEGFDNVFLTPAFLRQYAADLGLPVAEIPGMDGARVRLKSPDQITAFAAAAKAVDGGQIEVAAGSDAQTAATHAQRAAHLQAIALLVFGLLAALATLLIVGQSLIRQSALDAGESRTLWAIGTTPRQLFLIALIRAAVVGIVGAVLAAGFAIALSPLSPMGTARAAEIQPGLEVDAIVVLVGGLIVAVVVIALSTAPAWRRRLLDRTGGREPIHRPARLGSVAARSNLPVPAITGLTLRAGRPTLGTRTATAATLVALAGLAASLTFAVSLDRLAGDAAEQGWTWDVLVGNPNGPDDIEAAATPLLAANPDLGGFTAIAGEDFVTIDGQPVTNVTGADLVRGSVHPPLLDGRPPTAAGEVVLATRTLRQLHRHVGDTVTFAIGSRRSDISRRRSHVGAIVR